MVAIVLVPSRQCIDRLLKINLKFVDELDGKIRLDHDKSLPHLSLLHAPGVAFSEVLQTRVESILGTIQISAPLQIGLEENPLAYVETGWYFIDALKTEELVHLHEVTFRCLVDLMLPGAKTRDELPHYAASQWENYEKYGYRYIGSDYHPHVTVTRADGRAKNELMKQLELEVKQSIDIVEFSSILVCDIGPNGTTGPKHFQKRFGP